MKKNAYAFMRKKFEGGLSLKDADLETRKECLWDEEEIEDAEEKLHAQICNSEI